MKHKVQIPKRDAFSLIELLVALTLFGILAASMAGILRNTSESVEQGGAELDNLARMRSLDLLLGSALRDADAKQLSQRERRLLSSMDNEYDPAYGKYRFRGEEGALGFCMPRPFTGGERDGYMHWVTLEVREEEDESGVSLWLRDVSFLREIDNPAGERWEGSDLSNDYALPTQEICLIKEAPHIGFRFLELEKDGMAGEPEPTEMEPEDIEGDYARILPNYIEMDVRLPNLKTETLTFEWNAKQNAF
ncbi:type II secretion system protein J [Verrucomicrobiota bacterium]